MANYSGRTTALAHKQDDWQSVVLEHPIPPAISQVTVFNAQWTDCPVEVEDEVKKLWHWQEFGNDNYYYSWDTNSEYWGEEDIDGSSQTVGEAFPLIDEYLKSKGITKCLIHWWW